MCGLLEDATPPRVGLKYSIMAHGAPCVMTPGTSQTLTLCADNSVSLEHIMHGRVHTSDKEQVKYSWTTSTAMEMSTYFKIVFFPAGVFTIVAIKKMLP